jgi:hypothetical protein
VKDDPLRPDPDLYDRRAAAAMALVNSRWIWPGVGIAIGSAPFAHRGGYWLLPLAVAMLLILIGAWRAMRIVGRSLREAERRIEKESRERKE